MKDKNNTPINPICLASLSDSKSISKRTVLDLAIGEVGLVKSFDNLDCACKLLTLGILPKSKIVVIRRSPLGDALYLQLNGNKIALRNNEGAAILIEE